MKFKHYLTLFIVINASVVILMSCVSLPDPVDNTRSLIILSFKGKAADEAYIVKLDEYGGEYKTIRQSARSHFYKNHDAKVAASYGYNEEGYFYFANVKPGKYTIKGIYHTETESSPTCSIPVQQMETEVRRTYTNVVFSDKIMSKFIINIAPQKVYFMGDFFETEKTISHKESLQFSHSNIAQGKNSTDRDIDIYKELYGSGMVTKKGRAKAIGDLIKKYPDSKWIQYLKNDEINQLNAKTENSKRQKSE